MNTDEIESKRPGNPLISVVTVVFNRAAALEATIKSVITQSYPHVEYIIIDGGSTDGTVDILKKYSSKITIWLSEPDNGIYDAMNKGIRKATGQWINFMNCGDRFYGSDALSFFQDSAIDGDVIYANAMIEYPTFNTLWTTGSLDDQWKRPAFCHQAAFVRTEIMKATPFDTRFRLSSDFDFIYKMWLARKKFTYVDKIICWYDLKEGASLKNRLLSLRERRASVLQQRKTFWRSVYFTRIILYERISSSIKQMIGKRGTAWITQHLRK